MANYRNVSTSFWTDPKVDDEFTPEDKYFYLYLITNPHTNICGCYEVGKRQIERELGYTWDMVSRLIDRMVRVHNVVRYSEETKEILLLHWGKYNWGRSDKVAKAVYGIANEIKNKTFKAYVTQQADRFFYQKPVTDTDIVTDTDTDTSIGYAYPMHRVSDVDKSRSYPRKKSTNKFDNYQQRDIDYDSIVNQIGG